MPSQAKLRSDLVSAESTIDGELFYTVKDPITGNYFRLRSPEFWLINQLDGQREPAEVANRFREKFDLEIGVEDVEQFIGRLEQLFFLEDGRSEQEIARAAKKAGRKRSVINRLLYIKIKGFTPGRALDRLVAVVRSLRKAPWVVVQTAIIATGLVLLAANAPYLSVDLSSMITWSSVWLLIVALFLLVGIHEFAHAAVCRFYGGQVREMGFLLMYFQPCFYCDLSDAWLFKRKSQRLAVTWAGPYFQLFLLAVSVIIWRMTVEGTFVSNLARMTAVVSWFTFLFNFNPLIKLDGYYLLSDWLEIPNLRQKAFGYLGNVLRRRLLGWPIEKVIATSRERRVYVTYAVLAFVYSSFLVGYFFWVVGGYIYAKTGGPGLLLSVVAFAIIIRGALETMARGVTQHFRYMKALLHKPVRLVVYTLLLAALIIIASIPWCPHRISGEVAVIPLEQFTLSLNNLGLLESTLRRGGETPDRKSNWLTIITSNELSAVDVLPRVKDGQHVRAGDTIATLTSNQVIQSIASGEAELQRLEGQLALLKAPPKKEQVDEAAAQVRASQASYDQLKRDLTRAEELASKKLLAQDQLEADRSAVAVAKADLENKKSALALVKSKPRPEEETVLVREIEKQKYLLDYYKKQSEAQIVVSPIAGTVGTNRRVDTILTVTNDDIVEMDVPVSDFDILLVAKDQPVKAKVRSYPGMVFEGKVVRIPPFTSAFSEGQRFPVAVLVDNQQKLIRQGMTGYAKIEVGQTSLINLAFRKILSALRVEFWSWW